MDLNEHMLRKELISMRESAESDWRSELQEEGDHPYVDIMPCADEAQQMKKDKKKEKKKKEETPEREEVKEGFFNGVNREKQKAARERLDKHRTAMKGDGDSPYYGKVKGKSKETGKDPWATHPSDQKVFAKDMRELGRKSSASVKEEVPGSYEKIDLSEHKREKK
jgi:hypothetical protein